jgi:putative hydrolase of the HAD superfamily
MDPQTALYRLNHLLPLTKRQAALPLSLTELNRSVLHSFVKSGLPILLKNGRSDMNFDLIAFDADDTLWHNETLYEQTQFRLQKLLSGYVDEESVVDRLYETEKRNLEYYGYGIKSFTLSMIETAIELTDGQIRGRDIEQIITFAREMLETPTQLLEHVEETIAALSKTHKLMIITKGDLFDQETKIAQSGLADYFTHIEIVSEKTPDTYQSLLDKHNINPSRFLMVGNSLRSDVLPVVEVGGRAVHIPYHITWQHETAANKSQADYLELEHIGLLPNYIEALK